MRAPATLLVAGALLAGACDERTAEDPTEWFDEVEPRSVEEPIAYTTTNYDFPPSDDDGIADLLATNLGKIAGGFDTAFAPADLPEDFEGCQAVVDQDLPREVEGVVTLHPRWYVKVSGCQRFSDEKYYGSYFIQDRTGGIFVLGDSKVAKFDVGARVRLRVRAVRDNFDQPMIYAHDVVAVDHERRPVYFETPSEAFEELVLRDGPSPVGRNWLVDGEVITAPDTFGQFVIERDDGAQFDISMDAELNRRNKLPPVGTQFCAIGPLLVGFGDVYPIAVQRVGQMATYDSGDCPLAQ